MLTEVDWLGGKGSGTLVRVARLGTSIDEMHEIMLMFYKNYDGRRRQLLITYLRSQDPIPIAIPFLLLQMQKCPAWYDQMPTP